METEKWRKKGRKKEERNTLSRVKQRNNECQKARVPNFLKIGKKDFKVWGQSYKTAYTLTQIYKLALKLDKGYYTSIHRVTFLMEAQSAI